MDVRLPKLGEGAESGTVVSLMVKEGDTISEGQTLLELENEKDVAPIPSSVSGKVTSVRVKEGDKISVGQVILSVAETRESSKAPQEKADSQRSEREAERSHAERQEPAPPEEKEEVTEPPAPPSKTGLAPAASPSLRKMARELGIDLTRIRGSEPGGRIVLADLRAYIQRLQKLALEPKPAAPGKPKVSPAEQIDFSKWGPITRKPLSQLRKVITQRMTESWTTVPHVTQFDEADITALNE